MQIIISSYQDEFNRYQSLAENAIKQVDGQQYMAQFGDASIAMYVKHLGGNLLSRYTDFLTTDGEKEWRNRDGEFEYNLLKRVSCEEIWQKGWSVLYRTLANLSDADLNKIVIIRKIDLTVVAALTRSLAHTAYHVGQIVLLAKMQKNNQWQSLSIPRGQSSTYNASPTLEKAVPKK
jgi:hypothetical protein